MPMSNWFKTRCKKCNKIIDCNKSRYIILYQDRSGMRMHQATRGHYCEKCFKKI